MSTLSNLLEKYDRLTSRERVLIMLATTGLCFFLIDALLLTPQQRQLKQLATMQLTQQTELGAMRKALAQLSPQASDAIPADQARQAEETALRQQVDAFEKLVGSAGTTLGEIGSTAQNLLAEHPGVALISLKSLPVSPFAAASDGYPALQRLGLELGLRGSYPALLAYLKDLERRAGTVYWSDLKLESNYPDATLNLAVNLLRPDGAPKP